MIVAVALEKSNLGSLRDMQHRDQYGNPISMFLLFCLFVVVKGLLIVIAEPDISNPTRPRFERPLDTIRSFEAAIYGKHDRPVSYARTGMCRIPTSLLIMANSFRWRPIQQTRKLLRR